MTNREASGARRELHLLLDRAGDREEGVAAGSLGISCYRPWPADAVREAIGSGELTTDTDVETLVELLVAVMWGMGFYAGYVGSHADLERVIEKFELLLANKLWSLPT